ncbi:hypothetical protein [Mycobacterium sherrisii]|uniref:hypothetical protein n=1 Tax=Mycobacterium sherrisii TaxID=243061 RepID=UPI000A1527A9|nr:hypothetical protein [Mycobacterium sherrisii]MCV7031085.1 hypothetical protein [Mycobacterium sherrisii]ORW82487.1 hypothetical protein AWC25_00020 [Mycobacterium sherrisii]
MSEFDETNRRINRANAEVGGLAFPPGAWHQEIDPLTDTFDTDDFLLELPYDSEPVARRIAGHMVKDHLHADSGSVFAVRSVLDTWCPEHDEASPLKMATLYALSYANIAYLIPLRSIEQVKEVAEFVRSSHCEARVTRRCTPKRATKFLAVKRNEFMCLFVLCRECKLHIHNRAGFNEDYIGPAEDWFDDRTAQIRTSDDPFDDPFQ